jgi:hypothetical protein
MRRKDAEKECEEKMQRKDAEKGCRERMRKKDAEKRCGERMQRKDAENVVSRGPARHISPDSGTHTAENASPTS